MDFCGRLQVGGFLIPKLVGVRSPLSPALVHLHIVELDDALLDVHGPSTRDIGLEGQRQERDVIDEEEERVPLDGITEGQLPLQFVVLQFKREKSRVVQFFPTKLVQKYEELENAVGGKEKIKDEETRDEQIFTLAL